MKILVSDVKSLIDDCDIHLHMDFQSLLAMIKIIDFSIEYLRKSAKTKSIDYKSSLLLKQMLIELRDDYLKLNN